jgi:quinolinate synthase
LSPELIRRAKILLWAGNCQVHQRLTTEDVVYIRDHYPEAKIIVHPECNREVVEQADASGSTGQIIEAVESSKPDSNWVIGTECHLVDYLKKQHPDKQILQLGDRSRATCRAMSRVTPQHVLWVLDKISAGDPVNIVRVNKDIAQNASKALNKMIEVTSAAENKS